MRNELNNLVQYFCMYPGGNANDFVGTIKPHAEKLAHPNLTIHTAKGTMNKEQWLAFLESFANGGGMAEPLLAILLLKHCMVHIDTSATHLFGSTCCPNGVNIILPVYLPIVCM